MMSCVSNPNKYTNGKKEQEGWPLCRIRLRRVSLAFARFFGVNLAFGRDLALQWDLPLESDLPLEADLLA